MLLELGGKIGSTPGAGFVPFAAGLQAIAPEVQSALKSERDAQAQNIKDQANLDLQMYGFKQKDIQAGVDAYFHKYDAYTRAATTAIDDAQNNERAVHITQIQDDAAWQRTQADIASRVQLAQIQDASATERTQAMLDKDPRTRYAMLSSQLSGMSSTDPEYANTKAAVDAYGDVLGVQKTGMTAWDSAMKTAATAIAQQPKFMGMTLVEQTKAIVGLARQLYGSYPGVQNTNGIQTPPADNTVSVPWIK
jgi:hypothetical protein